MEKYKIILTDDHQIVLDGLTSILEDYQEYDIIGQAKNGKEAIHLVGLLKPDLIILDIDMPVMNGLLAAKEIKENHPGTKIIILSLHQDGAVIRKLIQLGIDGYLLKSSDSKEMINAIEIVRSGRSYFSGEVTLKLTQKQITLSDDGTIKMSSLTDREIEILKAIAEGHSSREIGEMLFISARTVDTHRTNMMKKLKVTKVVGLLRWAIKWGLVD